MKKSIMYIEKIVNEEAPRLLLLCCLADEVDCIENHCAVGVISFVDDERICIELILETFYIEGALTVIVDLLKAIEIDHANRMSISDIESKYSLVKQSL